MSNQAWPPTVLEAIRMRPGMYIGDRGQQGVEHLIYELVANVIDLFLAGQATTAKVSIREGEIIVEDDGPGLPYDELMPDSKSRAENWLTGLHKTATADGHYPHVHLNFAGLGLVVVTALSRSLRVVTHRNGHRWEQHFERGNPSPPRKTRSSGRGTRFSFVPDDTVLEAILPRAAMVRRKLFDSVHLFPGFTLSFGAEVFQAPNGLGDYARFLGAKPTRSFSTGDEKYLHVSAEEKGVLLEAAALGSASRCGLVSWCNGILTIQHGSHVDGFRDVLRRMKWTPAIALIQVVMTNPHFAGPCRDKLVAPGIRKAVRDAVWTRTLSSST